MAGKTANVTARVQPEIKQKAEDILDRLGVPVSVLIDSLYRQIIMTNSIPYQKLTERHIFHVKRQ